MQHAGKILLTPVEYVTQACLRDLGQHGIVYGTAKNELEVFIIFKFIGENFSSAFNSAMSWCGKQVLAH